MTIADIDQAILDKIKELLEAGRSETDTAILTKSISTYWRWKEEIPEFKDFVTEAILNYKGKLILSANVAATKSGKTSMELLRRRWPDEWNVPQKVEHTGELDVNIKTVESIIDDLLEDDDTTEETKQSQETS